MSTNMQVNALLTDVGTYHSYPTSSFPESHGHVWYFCGDHTTCDISTAPTLQYQQHAYPEVA